MFDCLIVGRGIIGLSIAVEMAEQGHSVAVSAAQAPGGAASWAAGGILPPPATYARHDPVEQLRCLADSLYAEWCERLRDTTRIDPELLLCGGLYVARTPAERLALQSASHDWQGDGITVEQLDPSEWTSYEPELPAPSGLQALFRLPNERQVRPPRLLKALTCRCRQLGIRLDIDDWIRWVRSSDGSAVAIETATSGRHEAKKFVIAAGPWSAAITRSLGMGLPLEPRRGQILMWERVPVRIRHIVNEGPRYLIQRRDGTLLVGSTVEDVGFDNRPTREGIEMLRAFATALCPPLTDQPPSRVWSGLRPFTADGWPYVGSVPGFPNVLLASGHYRSGIHLAPATARLAAQWCADRPTDIPLRPFRVDR